MLLECFSESIQDTASGWARYFELELGFPGSTYWHNLRKLRALGLVEFGSGVPVRLSLLAKERVGGENNETPEVEEKLPKEAGGHVILA